MGPVSGGGLPVKGVPDKGWAWGRVDETGRAGEPKKQKPGLEKPGGC
jgi:hypothetical protein